MIARMLYRRNLLTGLGCLSLGVLVICGFYAITVWGRLRAFAHSYEFPLGTAIIREGFALDPCLKQGKAGRCPTYYLVLDIPSSSALNDAVTTLTRQGYRVEHAVDSGYAIGSFDDNDLEITRRVKGMVTGSGTAPVTFSVIASE